MVIIVEKTNNCGPSAKIVGSDEDEDVEKYPTAQAVTRFRGPGGHIGRRRGTSIKPTCTEKWNQNGTYTFPYRVQNSSACALIVTEIQVIPLTDCDDGASEKIRSVSLPTGQKCGCKRFLFD
uniref:Ephrin n=1 Tax=Angiostrongylus cantonensis TaxID=6313 RepID=A0A0K0D5B7_ANGCA